MDSAKRACVVLSGGVALGSYRGGAWEALLRHDAVKADGTIVTAIRRR